MAANSDVIDWPTAVAVGRRLHPRGPHLAREAVREAIDSLTHAAESAVGPVRDITGMFAPYDPSRTQVVARPEWIRANVEGFAHSFGPALLEVRDRGTRRAPIENVGRRVTAAQLGAVLAWLSGKVLGQFDVFREGEQRLMLVAPTIVEAQSALGVPARDFHLWVCLHEETHRVQFSAVPWLTDYLIDGVQEFILADDEQRLLERVRSLASGRGGLVEIVSTPSQRRILDRLAAAMSVLEGHAEVVMDAVGPQVVPSVAVIRSRFDDRRAHPARLDGLLRRIVGLDAKLRQYTEGAAFVRGVVDTVGMEGFNEVWTSPEQLPTAAEIAAPAAWVQRVHG